LEFKEKHLEFLKLSITTLVRLIELLIKIKAMAGQPSEVIARSGICHSVKPIYRRWPFVSFAPFPDLSNPFPGKFLVAKWGFHLTFLPPKGGRAGGLAPLMSSRCLHKGIHTHAHTHMDKPHTHSGSLGERMGREMCGNPISYLAYILVFKRTSWEFSDYQI